MRWPIAILGALQACATAGAGRAWIDDPLYGRESVELAEKQYLRDCAQYANSRILTPPIEPGDGIDRCEAKNIADSYLFKQCEGRSDCAEPMYPVEARACWLVPVLRSFALEPGAPVRVDKRSGAASTVPSPGR